jgi:uronate dehydrogenase
LLASSNHATGFYRRDQTIDHRVYPKPDSRYGVSKVFGEALGSLYADKYGMEVFLMRIGNVNPKPIDKRRLSIWLSPRDLAQLVSIGIDHPSIKFEIVYGISDIPDGYWDNTNAFRLGYEPRDKPADFVSGELDSTEHAFQGGSFATDPLPGLTLPSDRSRESGR